MTPIGKSLLAAGLTLAASAIYAKPVRKRQHQETPEPCSRATLSPTQAYDKVVAAQKANRVRSGWARPESEGFTLEQANRELKAAARRPPTSTDNKAANLRRNVVQERHSAASCSLRCCAANPLVRRVTIC